MKSNLEFKKSAWKVQRICIWATDSFAKSGESTDSLTFSGKIYRFFDEIRREKVKAIMPDSWAWNAHLVWVKVLRHGALFRQNVQTWRENQAPRWAPMKSNLEFKKSAWKVQRICIWATDSLTKSGKSTESLTFSGKIYRFFAEIRHVLTRVLSPNFEPETPTMSE